MVDYGQTDLGLIQLALFLQSPKFVEVTYTPPGGATVTDRFWPEQITINGNIAGTTIKMLMTPITYYNNFILNDDVFGIIGGSPTYNSEIKYNEADFTYDDNNVEQGSRLGV